MYNMVRLHKDANTTFINLSLLSVVGSTETEKPN